VRSSWSFAFGLWLRVGGEWAGFVVAWTLEFLVGGSGNVVVRVVECVRVRRGEVPDYSGGRRIRSAVGERGVPRDIRIDSIEFSRVVRNDPSHTLTDTETRERRQ
jgi:hypothetical protein